MLYRLCHLPSNILIHTLLGSLRREEESVARKGGRELWRTVLSMLGDPRRDRKLLQLSGFLFC